MRRLACPSCGVSACARRDPPLLVLLAPVGALVLAAALALVAACTPAERREAAAIEAAVAPTLCALVPLVAPSGSPAGLVCSDVAKAIGAALTLASADAPTLTRAANSPATCTPLYLHDLDPSRAPAEYVCAEAVPRAVALRALGVGHAR